MGGLCSNINSYRRCVLVLSDLVLSILKLIVAIQIERCIMNIKKSNKPMEVIQMFKKMLSSLVVGSVLLVGSGTDTETVENVELQKAANHAPIIKEEFKATGYYQVPNVKDSADTLPLADIKDSPQRLEIGKTYKVSFKNDYPIKIK